VVCIAGGAFQREASQPLGVLGIADPPGLGSWDAEYEINVIKPWQALGQTRKPDNINEHSDNLQLAYALQPLYVRARSHSRLASLFFILNKVYVSSKALCRRTVFLAFSVERHVILAHAGGAGESNHCPFCSAFQRQL
jgi:hypothetical protein